MSDEPSKPGDAQPPPNVPSDKPPSDASSTSSTPSPSPLPVTEFVANVSPEAPQPPPQSPLVIPVAEFVERVLPESDAETVARYKATLAGPAPDPAPPAIEPDRFPFESSPISALAVVGWFCGLLGLALLVIYFSQTSNKVTIAPRPASPSIVFPTEQPSVAVTGEKTDLTIGADKPAPDAPVVVPEERKEQGKVGRQGEKKATNRPSKRVAAHAPRKRFYRRYYRSRDDGGFM